VRFRVFNCRRFSVGQHLYHDAAHELAPYLVVLLAVVPVGIMLQVLGFALRRVWRVIRRVVSRMNVYTQEMLSALW